MAKAQGKKPAVSKKEAPKKMASKPKSTKVVKPSAKKAAPAPKTAKAPARKPAKAAPAKKAPAKAAPKPAPKAAPKVSPKAAKPAPPKAASKPGKAVPSTKPAPKPAPVKAAATKPTAKTPPKPAPKPAAKPAPKVTANPAAKPTPAAPKAPAKTVVAKPAPPKPAPAKVAKPATPPAAAPRPAAKAAAPPASPARPAAPARPAPAPAPARPAAPPAEDNDKKRARRPRPRVQSSGTPAAAWFRLGENKPRPASFIPAPPRAEAPSLVAAPPASSDRLVHPEDLTSQAVRTVPVRVDVEQGAGRVYLAVSPQEVTLRPGEGIEWDFRYFGGADVIVDELLVEFEKPSPFSVISYRSHKPGTARPHRQLSGGASASAVGSRTQYTLRAMTPYKTELASVRLHVNVTA